MDCAALAQNEGGDDSETQPNFQANDESALLGFKLYFSSESSSSTRMEEPNPAHCGLFVANNTCPVAASTTLRTWFRCHTGTPLPPAPWAGNGGRPRSVMAQTALGLPPARASNTKRHGSPSRPTGCSRPAQEFAAARQENLPSAARPDIPGNLLLAAQLLCGR